jgi:cobalt-zinc-cadmium efflux system membrane fusion protein
MSTQESEPDAKEASPSLELPPTRFRKRHPRLLRAAVIAGISVPLLIGGLYVMHAIEPSATASTAPARDVPVLDGNVIRFSENFAKRSALGTVAVASKELAPVVKVTGTVTYDTRKFAAVGARIAGRVRRVFKVVGDTVKANEVLAELESAELGRAESLVFAARAKEMAAEADMKRERRLADARITAERDAELARAGYEAARSERVAAERAVEALGGDLVGPVGILQLRSPLAGRVVASKISRGQSVEPTDTAYEIADLSSLWVELRLFEADLSAVRVGDSVEISSATNPNLMVKGEVGHVGDVVDVETRSAPVRVVINNRDGRLRPGQSVHAKVHNEARAAAMPSIPRQAVTRIDGATTVFVLVDKGTVEPRRVKLGAEDASHVAVLDGLKSGERVVVEGMFALKSEIFR